MLKQLIDELCPYGVKHWTLEEIGDFYTGLTGKSKKDFVGGNRRFITYKNVYENPSVDITRQDFVKIKSGESQNMVEYGDILFTGSSETPEECAISSVMTKKTNEPFYLNSFTIGYRLFDKSILLPDFSKHLFRSTNMRIQLNRTANGVTRFNVSKPRLGKVLIPVPPIPIQEEIVRILDKFTLLKAELEGELEAELEARTVQYQYYRNALINHAKSSPKTKIMKELESLYGLGSQRPIGEVCEILVGGDIPKGSFSKEKNAEFSIPVISNGVGESAIHGWTDSPRINVPSVTVAARGTIGYTEYRDYPYFPIIRLICLIPGDEIQPKYLYHAVKTLNIKVPMTGIPQLTVPMIVKYTIPVPPLPIQETIVKVLDRFETLIHDLQDGLPGEISLRQKQYKYYRDKLLTFQDLKDR